MVSYSYKFESLFFFERSSVVDISKSVRTEIEFGSEVGTSIYVRNWSEKVDLSLFETDGDMTHRYEMKMPLEAARELGKNLCEAIIKYDEKKAEEQAAELEAVRESHDESASLNDE